jgi:2,3-bisphosphoglycerate-dependent phosphoglycerate mutase
VKKSTKKLYVLTHCESCYNKRGIFTGRVDSVLTRKGHKHAERLAEELRDKKIGLAFTSSLRRAKQTLGHILVYHPETKVRVDDRIVERDYGELSRKSKAKFAREHPELYPVYHRSYNVPPPGGESIKEVEERVLPFIKEVLELMRRKRINVLIVAHGNSIRPIRRYFEKLTVEQMMKLEYFRHKIFEYKVLIS